MSAANTLYTRNPTSAIMIVATPATLTSAITSLAEKLIIAHIIASPTHIISKQIAVHGYRICNIKFFMKLFFVMRKSFLALSQTYIHRCLLSPTLFLPTTHNFPSHLVLSCLLCRTEYLFAPRCSVHNPSTVS